MKPKDLKIPFSWVERKVLYQDRIWFIPDYYNNYQSFQFKGWSHPQFFGNDNPVHLEYCSGNGAWIVNHALEHPDINWVAVEKQFKRARKIWSKIHNHQLNNLIVICGEGMTTSRHFLKDRSLSKIFVNFPDPWPKERHAKHRIVQTSFAKEVHRTLINEGSITLVTDDACYSKQMIEVMSQADFSSVYPEPFYSSEKLTSGTSWFEELWRKKGRTIRYHHFTKVDR